MGFISSPDDACVESFMAFLTAPLPKADSGVELHVPPVSERICKLPESVQLSTAIMVNAEVHIIFSLYLSSNYLY
jgi:hypothetical protein